MQVLRIIWSFIIRIPLYKQRCGSWYTSHQNARHPQWANVINLLLRDILFVKQIQIVIKMELVKTENAVLFMFYQVLMENFITIHFPNLNKTSRISHIAKEGVVVKNSKKNQWNVKKVWSVKWLLQEFNSFSMQRVWKSLQHIFNVIRSKRRSSQHFYCTFSQWVELEDESTPLLHTNTPAPHYYSLSTLLPPLHIITPSPHYYPLSTLLLPLHIITPSPQVLSFSRYLSAQPVSGVRSRWWTLLRLRAPPRPQTETCPPPHGQCKLARVNVYNKTRC